VRAFPIISFIQMNFPLDALETARLLIVVVLTESIAGKSESK
jgi:hypothetical protein